MCPMWLSGVCMADEIVLDPLGRRMFPARPYRRGPEDELQAGEASTAPIPARRQPGATKHVALTDDDYARIEAVRHHRGEELPSPSRVEKGDLVTTLPRGQENDLAAVQHRVRRYEDPLWILHNRGTITREQMRAGHRLDSAYKRATMVIGAAKPENGPGGGSWNGGLAHARCDALDEFKALWAKLGADEAERYRLWPTLREVCCNGRSLRDIAGGGGRIVEAFRDILVIGLGRLAA